MMFRAMFGVCMNFFASSYLLPFWISCGGVVVAGACAVAIKSLIVGVK